MTTFWFPDALDGRIAALMAAMSDPVSMRALGNVRRALMRSGGCWYTDELTRMLLSLALVCPEDRYVGGLVAFGMAAKCDVRPLLAVLEAR